MPGINDFWDSLKISCARRLMNSECVWQKVLQLNLLHAGYEMKYILFGGPELVRVAGTSLENTFWKDTILAFAKLSDETPHAH